MSVYYNVGKARSGAPEINSPLRLALLALHSNIRQAWKGLSGTNALAYLPYLQATKKKYITLVPGREVLVAEVTLFPLDAEVRHLVTLASKAAGELLPAVRA